MTNFKPDYASRSATMKTYNETLGQQVYDQIVYHPETWNQKSWGIGIGADCGTVACVAGWAVHLTGWKSISPSFRSGEVTKGYLASTVEVAGQYELGLSMNQAEYLFNSVRTRDQIEEFLLKPEVRAEFLHYDNGEDLEFLDQDENECE